MAKPQNLTITELLYLHILNSNRRKHLSLFSYRLTEMMALRAVQKSSGAFDKQTQGSKITRMMRQTTDENILDED